ncbi:MAG: ROK family protein [Bacteroidota bacterium]|nr:ROK family protein [Bacteroidota bacterium]
MRSRIPHRALRHDGVTMIVIGIDIGGTEIKAGLVSLGAGETPQNADSGERVLHRLAVPTNATGGPSAVIEAVHRVVGELLRLSSDCGNAARIGIGVPGSVDHESGVVLCPPNLPGWERVPLARIVEAKWGMPVSIDNDANCAALAEARFGAGRGHRSFIALTLGTGVGSGIVLDGALYRGERGFGGEFGHMTIDYNGPQCNCGNTGCVEAYIGGAYIPGRARSYLAHHPESTLYGRALEEPGSLTPKILADAAASGDEGARAFLRETGELLGIAVASAVNLLDIHVFVIGGGIAGAGEPLFAGIASSARSHVLSVHRESIRILPARLGNEAGMLGAAALAAS